MIQLDIIYYKYVYAARYAAKGECITVDKLIANANRLLSSNYLLQPHIFSLSHLPSSPQHLTQLDMSVVRFHWVLMK